MIAHKGLRNHKDTITHKGLRDCTEEGPRSGGLEIAPCGRLISPEGEDAAYAAGHST